MAPDACEISICFFIKRKFYLDKIPIELNENEIWTCIDRGCGCPERLWQKMYPTVRNRCNWVWGTFHNPKGTRTVLFQGHWRICSGMRLKYIFHSKLFLLILCVKSFFISEKCIEACSPDPCVQKCGDAYNAATAKCQALPGGIYIFSTT